MRGKVYFVEILIAYEVGLSKETQRATVLTTCGGPKLRRCRKEAQIETFINCGPYTKEARKDKK